MNWSSTLIAGWGVMLAVSAFHATLPASWWFDAGTVHVSDARPGECPAMDFDRTIERDFRAEWVVTIMKQRIDGRFTTYGTYTGGNDYRPENVLPDDLNLCWWTWEDDLRLMGGAYKVNTLWVLDVDGGEREIRRSSNAFRVGLNVKRKQE